MDEEKKNGKMQTAARHFWSEERRLFQSLCKLKNTDIRYVN